ncbi:MAG: DUF4292 domain-containing protein [Myxococcota bacterium]|nr:DUF4292 domain-containing protein [Myxococcota bacterium]
MTRRALACAALVGLVLGCRTAPPTWTPLSATDPRPERLLAAQAARREARQGLRATARVRFEGQGSGSFAKETLLLERPARLRVEVLGLLGQRVAVLASDGEEYALWRAETKRLERGPVHPAILWEVAGVPLRPAEAVALLLGAPALPAAPPAASRAEGAVEGGGVRLAGEDDDVLRVAEFDAAGRLRAWRVGRPGEVWLEARWADYRETERGAFAHRVELDFPTRDQRARVDFHQVELDPELPAELFRLELSQGASS